MSSLYSTVKKALLSEAAEPTSAVNRVVVIDHTGTDEKNFGRILDKAGVAVKLSYQDDGRTLKVFISKKDSGALDEDASGGEAFDKFDELYLKNHRDSISKLQDGADKESLDLDPDKAEEVFQFWDMHRAQVAERLKEDLNEGRGYGGWLSPSGRETPVSGRMDHGPVAERILGDEWEERKGQGLEAAEILGKRGYARLVHEPNRTFVDMDTNAKLTHRQLSYLKDLGIENQVDVYLDVGMGRYLYRAGE